MKNNTAQSLIHEIKYKDNPVLGEKLAARFANRILKYPHLPHVDAIVPVPLHPKKMRLRGYNQAAYIAGGFASVLQVPVVESILIRTHAGDSQTKKSRLGRFHNVDKVFDLGTQANNFAGKHILLVDDVLTTGATIEMCWEALSQIPDLKISIATLAIAV